MVDKTYHIWIQVFLIHPNPIIRIGLQISPRGDGTRWSRYGLLRL